MTTLKQESLESSETLPKPMDLTYQLALLQEAEQIDEELERRQSKYKLRYYTPNLIQFCFHLSRSLTKAFFGGNRSGKTTAVVVELLWHLTKWYPDWYPEENRLRGPVKIRLNCEDFTEALPNVISPKLEEWLPESELVDKKKNQQGHYIKYFFKDGSTLSIMTYEQESKKHEGTSHHIVAYDEPPPRDTRIAEKRGLVDYNGKELFGLTPLSEPWLFDEIYDTDDPTISSYIADMRDNLRREVTQELLDAYTNVPPSIREFYAKHFLGKKIGAHTDDAIKNFEKDLMPHEIDARIHGKFMYLSGLVYKIFNPVVHVISPITLNNRWPRYFAMDPHDRKGQFILWGCVDPTEDVYIYRERRFQLPMIIPDCTLAVKQLEQRYEEHVVRRIIDPNFGQKIYGNSGRTVAQEWSYHSQQQGYRMSFTMGNDELVAGHNKVYQYMKYDTTKPISIYNHPKVYIFDTCPELIKSLKHYVWDEWEGKTKDKKDEKEKPRDKWKDFPDCLRYMLMDNPRFHLPQVYKPPRTLSYT